VRRGRPGNRGPRLARYRARGHAGRCSTSATPVAGEWGLPTIVASPAQAEGAPTGPARSHSRRRRRPRPRPATAIATGGTIRYPGDAGAMWSGATTATTSTTRAVPRAAVDGADLVADGVNGATVRPTDQGATPTVSTTLQLIAVSSADAAITLAVANFAAICGRASGTSEASGASGASGGRPRAWRRRTPAVAAFRMRQQRNGSMPSIAVRNVPDDARVELAARAARRPLAAGVPPVGAHRVGEPARFVGSDGRLSHGSQTSYRCARPRRCDPAGA